MHPRPSLARAFALFLATFLLAAALHGQSGEAPRALTEREIAWSKAAPFSLTSGDLLAWGQLPEAGDEDVVVLLNSTKCDIDSQGRATLTHHLIYRTRTQASAERWAPLEAYWAPWSEERPQIDGRVVSADGAEHRLDPKTIDDAPASDTDSTIYSDRRRLRAPLPGVGPGAVVEQLVIVREKQPAFEAGFVRGFRASRRVPVRVSNLEISSPENRPVLAKTYLFEVTPVRESANGVVHLRYRTGPFNSDDEGEDDTPGEVRQSRSISYTTGTSWNAIASRYHEIVEERLASSDLTDLARKTIGKEKNRERIIALLVSKLHRDIRYTGVEFAEASIVPAPPSETVTRRFGDCKDKSSVLVAMLRAAGIPASLALLSTGPGRDIDPELPGFGWFDHAIVYIPGSPARWIDATDELGELGSLPPASEGRLALIAAPETRELTKTAESVSADNWLTEERELHLAEFGKAAGTETTRVTGSFGRRYRRGYDGADEKTVRERIEGYIKNAYLSEQLKDFRHPDPRDLSTPFTLRIEMTEAGRGTTNLAEAVVGIFPSGLIGWLPSEFLEPESDPKDGATVRKHDYVFSEPFTVEWKYRIVAPAGFRARTLPESKRIPLGSAAMTMDFSTESDRVVLARFTLDSGKRRLTPAEYEELRKAALEFQKTEAMILGFDQIGHAHLSAGNIREALEAFRGLVAAHPKDALHHGQVALALLEAGLGEAARREIDQAVKLDPRSAICQQLRGWIYQHDLLGRRFRKGFDRDEAAAGYRAAKDIDPKDPSIRANLAILLEHDKNGLRYGPGSELGQAIAEYEALRADLKNEDYLHNQAIALLRAARFEELRTLADKNPGLENRRELLLAAGVAIDGVESIASLAAKLVPDSGQRSSALSNVGETFVATRQYPLAVAALTEAAKGSPNAANLQTRAAIFRKVSRREDLTSDENDPATVAKRLFAATLAPDSSVESILPFLTKAMAVELRDSEVRKRADEILPYLRNRVGRSGAETDVLIDLFLGTMYVSREGNDEIGYRVGMRAAGPEGELDESYFVVREDGAYRVADPLSQLLGMGMQAKRLAGAGNLSGARKWLDWAREQVPERVGDDPLSGSPFLLFWKKGQDGGADEIADAAAVLMLACSKPVAEEAVAHLRSRAEKAGTDEERLKYEAALAFAFAGMRDGAQLVQVSDRLSQKLPKAESVFMFRISGLALLHKSADIVSASRKRLESDPEDWMAMRVLANALGELGDVVGSVGACNMLIEKGRATAGDYNNAAWYSLFANPIPPVAMDYAQQAVSLEPRYDGYLHTLATLYAEQGKTSEAKAAIWEAMDAGSSETPRSYDWYVLGRIAEQHGIREAAINAYKKVTKGEELGDDGPFSTWALAQKRLTAMGVK